ncbi:hypothetical protein [Candidatus Tisiphia endosymbiont of Nemotelus uliginosus]|uniref:hypothetical protein n=1 Tax=Candidatus Tisiphia endosymbiont of Nemotelus uliginosus TaxID=3077926 RepID=UPI0035C88E01
MEDINQWQEKFERCAYSDRLINKLTTLNTELNKQVDIKEHSTPHLLLKLKGMHNVFS